MISKKMSILKSSMLVAMFAALPLAAVQVSAQTKGVVVDVPFAFVANHTSLPAGHYRITSQGTFLKFADADTGKSQAVLMSRPESGKPFNEDGKLEFFVSGHRHVLTEVRFGGTGSRSVLLIRPKPERVEASNPESTAKTIEIGSR